VIVISKQNRSKQGRSKQNWARVAAVGVVVAARGLSACGRKGPLDPPPSAASHSPQAAPDGSPQLDSGRQPAVGVGSDGKAVAPPPTGQRQPFILDWLVE
jgi:predicted small lipoprotein YifL